MKQYILPLNKTAIICAIVIMIGTISGCSKEEKYIEPIMLIKYALCFTENPDIENEMETVYAGPQEQTMTLRIISLLDESLPMPERLGLYIHEWNDESNSYNEDPLGTNTPEDFYHISTVKEDGVPVIKVELSANNTSADRRVKIEVNAYDHRILLTGCIEIIQSANDQANQSFTLKAKYKGKIYTTEAEIDNNGDFVIFDEEYKQLMEHIDESPNVQMVIMEDSIIHYYDTEDIVNNEPLSDLKKTACADTYSHYPSTRTTGFEKMTGDDLGYMAMYVHDNFRGDMHYKGLTNYHFTYNILNLKSIDLNDKITSIALGYNGSDPIVCTVLTIWDDADFNHGDDKRSKHRISIVASQNNRRVTVPNLKRIKKIGSSKSWNDCLSCFSLHFGYIDRFLIDY